MSAIDEIEAAIQKLTAERDERDYHEVSGYLCEIVEGASGAIDDPGYAPLTNDELIVTLHRTIDVQLAILRAGLASIAHWIDPDSELGYESWDGEYPPNAEYTYLALARAINNTSA